ncbi:MAG: queuosine precursor transporter [Chloroflexota bacterium]
MLFLWIGATLAGAGASALLGRRWGAVAPTTIFVSLVLIANVTAGKIVDFWGRPVPAAVIIYATTFLVTDIITEVWGKNEARKAVWLGFYANLVLVLYIFIVLHWQPMPFAQEYAQQFGQVFGLVPRVVLASMVAYLLSQHHDVWAFHWLREKTGGKHLWLRNNASTLVSQAIDTLLFITIAFWGVFPVDQVGQLIIGQYIAKVVIALLDTPFCYIFCRLAKSSPGDGR